MDPEDNLNPADPGTDPNSAPAGDPAAPVITDELRNQILSEAVTRGDVVPAWMLQGDPGQPPTRDAPPANVRPTMESCEFDAGRFAEELSGFYERQTLERERALEERLVGQFGPAIAEGRAASMVANVTGIAPAARPYLDQMIKAAGAEAANWTPAQRLIVENAAIGQALRDGKIRPGAGTGYQPEPSGGPRVPDVTFGADTRTGESYGAGHVSAMDELFGAGFGRLPTDAERKAAGVYK